MIYLMYITNPGTFCPSFDEEVVIEYLGEMESIKENGKTDRWKNTEIIAVDRNL